jgi:hypothetical protein
VGLVISLYDITSMGVERYTREMDLFTVIFRFGVPALRKQVLVGQIGDSSPCLLHPSACMSNGNVIIIIELSRSVSAPHQNDRFRSTAAELHPIGRDSKRNLAGRFR